MEEFYDELRSLRASQLSMAKTIRERGIKVWLNRVDTTAESIATLERQAAELEDLLQRAGQAIE